MASVTSSYIVLFYHKSDKYIHPQGGQSGIMMYTCVIKKCGKRGIFLVHERLEVLKGGFSEKRGVFAKVTKCVKGYFFKVCRQY